MADEVKLGHLAAQSQYSVTPSGKVEIRLACRDREIPFNIAEMAANAAARIVNAWIIGSPTQPEQELETKPRLDLGGKDWDG